MDALKPSDLGQVVCVHEGWTLVLDEDATPTPATKALADLMQAVFPLAVERVNAEFPNTPLNGAVVLLAHKGYAEDWDVHDAVGFQAVASEVQTVDILPRLKAGDSQFTEQSPSALTCRQDLPILQGLTPPVRRPIRCVRR